MRAHSIGVFRLAVLKCHGNSFSRAASTAESQASGLRQSADELIQQSKKPFPNPPQWSRPGFLFSTLLVLSGAAAIYLWPKDQQQQQLASPFGFFESPTLGAMRQEKFRLEDKYNRSWAGGRMLSWVSQGPAHWHKIQALKQAEKELDTSLGGPGCFSEKMRQALLTAYNDSPEPLDTAFKEKYLNDADKIGSFQRCKK